MALSSLHHKRIQYAGIKIPNFKDPMALFQKWFLEAQKVEKLIEPNAMVLSTVDTKRRPRSRYVLLKDFKDNSFIFYTNLNSAKSNELKKNPYASLLFYWPSLHRQVRIEGKIDFISLKDVHEYFQSRPKDSQIAASISKQSKPLGSRQELVSAFYKMKNNHNNKVISTPEFWGGFKLKADYIEFWSGMPHRLHDRKSYKRGYVNWKITRLWP